MLTTRQIEHSMQELIAEDTGDIQTSDMLELLHELLSFREAYPEFKVKRPKWDFILKKFVESH